jgi:TRAP-type C4-dicarboxylate transport system substrate-binding protein
MTLTVHSGGVLGSEIETLESVQMGTLDMAICSVSSMSGFTDSQNVFDLPYLFKTNEAAWGVLDGKIGQERCDAMADAGYKGLGYFYNGTYAIGSKKAITHPSDLAGVRVRSHASKIQSDSFTAVGAFPVSVAWGDIYTSLQQGTIDAVSGTTLTNMYSGKFYEQTPYITITAITTALGCRHESDIWNSLSPEDQEIVPARLLMKRRCTSVMWLLLRLIRIRKRSRNPAFRSSLPNPGRVGFRHVFRIRYMDWSKLHYAGAC